MRKGVVLKIKKDRAIIMADDCSYCEIKSFTGMYPGMEVCFREEDMLKKRKLLITNKYINAACFILLVFCSYLFLSFYQENMAAYAFVGIDINPSIEIALNRKGRIINARGLDEEGKEILEEVDVRKMDSTEGVKAIITKSIEMNYLETDNKNQITVYAVLNNKSNEDGKELIEKVEKVIKEEVVAHSIDGEVKTFVSDKKIKNEADKKGISVAKYIMENKKEDTIRKTDNKEKKEFITAKNNKTAENKDKKEVDDNKNIENKKSDKKHDFNKIIKSIKERLADNKNNKDKAKEDNKNDKVKNKEVDKNNKEKKEEKDNKANNEKDKKENKSIKRYENNEKDKDTKQVINNKQTKERKDNKNDKKGDNIRKDKNDNKDKKTDKSNDKGKKNDNLRNKK
ncbi:MAG: anti-sigma factor domain-containing protein, partial [Clostridiales bacterium]|nr:anti-sigma factor domain-containing protein [Clostridiales bacterium]